MEKILKETYVNPKIELTQNDYNRLVSLAQMNAEKIEQRAREIYEKEGVAKIHFDGCFQTRRDGERMTEHYKFDVACTQYSITPTGEDERTIFFIPEEARQKIARKVKNYVQAIFTDNFGEHLFDINAIKELKAKTERDRFRFLIWTVTGWLTSIFMLGWIALI